MVAALLSRSDFTLFPPHAVVGSGVGRAFGLATSRLRSAAWLFMLSASSAFAQSTENDQVEVLIGAAEARASDGSVFVELRILNDGDTAVPVPLADRIQASLREAGEERQVWLELDKDIGAPSVVPPHGFTHARYRMRAPAELPIEGATLSVPAISSHRVVITRARVPLPGRIDARKDNRQASIAPPPPLAAAPVDRAAGNQFVGNFSAYQPIYAVYGPGTNSEARIQLSFKYRLFGRSEDSSSGALNSEGLYFAYTQRMFWDLGAESSPFRNIDFQPELFYLSPSRTSANGASFRAQAGISHESNGRDGPASRSVNSIYIAPSAAWPLAGGYRLTVSPRLAIFFGDLSDNPNIRDYRGNSGLSAELGKDNGLRLSTFTRFSFGKRKGSFSADLSYPLPRIHTGLPSLYLFGQSFVGYGENLLDYNRHVTRFRIGLALVR